MGLQKKRNSGWNWLRTNETEENVDWAPKSGGRPNGQRNMDFDVTCSAISNRRVKPDFYERSCDAEFQGICMTGKCLDLDIIE